MMRLEDVNDTNDDAGPNAMNEECDVNQLKANRSLKESTKSWMTKEKS